MSTATLAPSPAKSEALDTIWFTRCPVPTATGLAYKLGWLGKAYDKENISVKTLQDNPGELSRHHYDHRLTSLVREGGNILAIAARAQGEKNKLVGLTWIDEWQSILVRPDSGITEARHLKGRRLALPTWSEHPIPAHARGSSIGRGMSLHGYKGALAHAGLTFDDVDLVEVDTGRGRRDVTPTGNQGNRSLFNLWPLQAVADGKADAAYVKGASAVDAARELGLVVGINLDHLPERRFRVNNGTPRPITVHESFIEENFEYLVRFLEQTLRAADWAADHLPEVQKILTSETRGSEEAVLEAYGKEFHKSLHPSLSEDRLALFAQQKKFLWIHGFLERDFNLESWVDRRPLEEARRRIAKG